MTEFPYFLFSVTNAAPTAGAVQARAQASRPRVRNVRSRHWTAPRPMGMALATSGALEFARADMRGSNPREYVSKDGTQVTLFSIRLGGRSRWGWFSIDAGGALRGYSKTFFPDYVSCLCDSQREPHARRI